MSLEASVRLPEEPCLAVVVRNLDFETIAPDPLELRGSDRLGHYDSHEIRRAIVELLPDFREQLESALNRKAKDCPNRQRGTT